MRSRILGAAALAAALILVPTAAHAGGSDSPTPYTVTAENLSLPDGTTFEANGHINYRMTKLDGSGLREFNVHQAVPDNGQWPMGQYIGKSVYTWTDHPRYDPADFPGGYCITWVQISAYNEHFGEGKQAPVCTTPPVVDPDPSTPPVVDPDPSTPPVVDPDPSTPPVVDPDPSTPPVVDPDPSTPPVVDPDPSTPPVVDPDPSTPPVVDPDPSTPPVVDPDPTDPVDVVLVDPSVPALVAPSEPPVITEVLAAGPSDTTANGGTLAATGSDTATALALGIAALTIGTLLVLVRRRTSSS